MQEEMMTAGNGGFSGSADATGPNAGYDPVMKFRSKVKNKKDKKLVMPGNKLKAEDKFLRQTAGPGPRNYVTSMMNVMKWIQFRPR